MTQSRLSKKRLRRPPNNVRDFFEELLKALIPVLEKLGIYLAGREAQKGNDAQKSLERVAASNRAAAGVDKLTDADVVSELKRRGLYRVSGKPAKRG